MTRSTSQSTLGPLRHIILLLCVTSLRTLHPRTRASLRVMSRQFSDRCQMMARWHISMQTASKVIGAIKTEGVAVPISSGLVPTALNELPGW
jgi:hypothetical protein